MVSAPSTPRALVVHSHPSPESFSHELCRRAVAGLEAGGHEVDLIDLYASGFAAAMSLEERVAYETDEPVCSDEVRSSIELVRGAQTLAFVYPTWWWGMPAVMKGWLERVLVPGVGFVFDEHGTTQPGLTHVRELVGVSTYGSRRIEMAALNDAGRRVVTRTLWLSAGRRRTRRTWLGLYGMDRVSASDRTDFADRVETRLARIGPARGS